MYKVSPTFPSSIVEDFNTYIRYCEQYNPKITKTNEYLNRKDVHELNKLMKQQTEAVTTRNDQHHYPMLHLFYHLSVQSDLFYIERKKSGAKFVPNKEKVEYFQQLNFSQQYLFLFKTFFIYCDWEYIQLQDRANINHLGTLDVFEWCAAHQPNETISFDNRTSEDHRLSWTVNSLGVIMVYLEFFGFWKCTISERYRTKTHLTTQSVFISDFGIKMCECIVKMGGYLKWNIYIKHELYEDFFETFVEFQNLLNSGKTQEEAEKIISEKYDNQEIETKEESQDLNAQDFEVFFQELFHEKLDRIIIKEPHEFQSGVYTFKVSLTYDSKIIRRIQLDAQHTLYDLHLMIQEAFNFEDDHLYSFYMDGKSYSKLCYNDPRSEEPPFVDEVTLGDSEFLSINKKILYLFDFGASWWFDIILEDIKEDLTLKGNGKIIESIGDSPMQYPDYEEDDW